MKSYLEFLIKNRFFQEVFKIFRYFIGIRIDPDLALFLANVFLMFAESKGFKYFKNAYYGVAKYFGNIFWLIDDVIAINDEKKNKI